MALRNLKIPVKAFQGKCDTSCSECSTARGVVAPDKTVDGSGIIYGRIVPDSLGRTVWQEGCQCVVNFEYDDTQLATNVILLPCEVGLVCGPVVDLVDKQELLATPCAGTRTCFSGVDTPSVDYTYDSVTGQHRADVKLSAAAGNRLVINADGLFYAPTVDAVVKASTIAKLQLLGLTLVEAESLYDA